MPETSIANSIQNVTEAIKRATMEPGTLQPCPMCGTPLCQRSVYVRCNPCGLNWENGSDLTKHPRHSQKKETIPVKDRSGRPASYRTDTEFFAD